MTAMEANAQASAVKEKQKSPDNNKSKVLGAADDGSLLMVTFTLADQTYGGDILQIQEVTGMSHITHVPHLKPFIRGVTNLRGNIVPTVDLRRRLGLEVRDDLVNQQIMIARSAQGLIGYIVDSVREVITVPQQAIEPMPEDWLDTDHKYFVGIAKLDDNLVTIVDFSRVIQIDGVLLDEIKQG